MRRAWPQQQIIKFLDKAKQNKTRKPKQPKTKKDPHLIERARERERSKQEISRSCFRIEIQKNNILNYTMLEKGKGQISVRFVVVATCLIA